MPIDLERLKLMSPEDRATLYENARKRRDKGGREIMEMIDNNGLSMSSGGLKTSDPVYLRMVDIIWSSESKKRLLEATANGLPALAGVEHLIVEDLGDRYQPHDQGTASAGSIVGEVMRHLGYELDGRGDMPVNSVAKTAAMWKARA